MTNDPVREALERHKLKAGDCPPQSEVVLVSSINRLLEKGLFDRPQKWDGKTVPAYRTWYDPPARGDNAAALSAPPPARDGLRKALDWPEGKLFRVTDDPGEHDPCYVVMPDGSALALNHHARPGVDIARAEWIVAACNAALASAQSGVPEGWKLVPIEPTEAMQRAGLDALDSAGHCDCDQHSVWSAMLAAAPAPQGEKPAAADREEG